MKKFFTLIAIMAGAIASMAQSFNTIPLDVELRDANGDIIANKTVGFKYNITGSFSTPSAVIERAGTMETDDNGILHIEIGRYGTATSNNNIEKLESFPFNENTKDKLPLKLEIDPNGGTNYTISGLTKIGYTVPFANYALVAKKAETIESMGDMPLHNVQIIIDNTTGVSVNVEFLGQTFTSGTSSAMSIPAYMPTYLSVKLSSYANYVEYQVLVNGKPVSNVSGTYEKASTLINQEYAEKASDRSYYYFQVRDRLNYDKAETEYKNLTKGVGSIADSGAEIQVSDFIPTNINGSVAPFHYENPLFIDNDYTDYRLYGNDYITGTESKNGFYYVDRYYRTNSPLFVKIPKPTITNSYSSAEIHKVKGRTNTMAADMINQIIGPFPLAENTITIKVFKNSGATGVY